MNYLKEYQKKLSLTPDGIIGKLTAKAMMNDLQITDKLFFAHLIAQMEHESMGFTADRESLNYSEEGLLDTFEKYYKKNPALAKLHARKPKIIANYVYQNRMGNGDYNSGDGWKYRGIFGIQLTGKNNIQDFISYLGFPHDTNPDSLLLDPKIYFLAGKFFFEDNRIDKICTNKSDKCISDVTLEVNNGHNGLTERIALTKKMFTVLEV